MKSVGIISGLSLGVLVLGSSLPVWAGPGAVCETTEGRVVQSVNGSACAAEATNESTAEAKAQTNSNASAFADDNSQAEAKASDSGASLAVANTDSTAEAKASDGGSSIATANSGGFAPGGGARWRGSNRQRYDRAAL